MYIYVLNLFKGSNATYMSIACFACYKLSDALNMFPLLTSRYITVAVCQKNDVCIAMSSLLQGFRLTDT